MAQGLIEKNTARKGMTDDQFIFDDGKKGGKDCPGGIIEEPETPENHYERELHQGRLYISIKFINRYLLLF